MFPRQQLDEGVKVHIHINVPQCHPTRVPRVLGTDKLFQRPPPPKGPHSPSHLIFIASHGWRRQEMGMTTSWSDRPLMRDDGGSTLEQSEVPVLSPASLYELIYGFRHTVSCVMERFPAAWTPPDPHPPWRRASRGGHGCVYRRDFTKAMVAIGGQYPCLMTTRNIGSVAYCSVDCMEEQNTADSME